MKQTCDTHGQQEITPLTTWEKPELVKIDIGTVSLAGAITVTNDSSTINAS